MSERGWRTEESALAHVSIVALAKAIVSIVTLATGFRALSDDDYARIVIAERFAAHPSLDPSGTSWLPFPFWLYGSFMALFGRSVETARALAFAIGIASAVGVYFAARWIGVSARASTGGALLSAVFPYSAWLGVATIPEVPTAALILIGIASLSQSGWRRTTGALALTLACLSRYEAWPVAATFVLMSFFDARRERRWQLAYPALLASAGPLLWLVNGITNHADALFFVKRVSEYRRAVGMTASGLGLTYPSLIVRAEPELFAIALVAVAIAVHSGARAMLARHARAAACLAVLVVFLIVGDLRDGAPTHHAERALLAVWFWLAVLAADAFASAWPKLGAATRAGSIAVMGLLVAPAAAILRPWYAARDSFIDRSAEIEMGARARAIAKPDERILVDTPDFAFFAVIAGFGAPERAAPFDDRDPRKPSAENPFASTIALSARVGGERANFVVVSGPHLELARELGPIEFERGGLALVRVLR